MILVQLFRFQVRETSSVLCQKEIFTVAQRHSSDTNPQSFYWKAYPWERQYIRHWNTENSLVEFIEIPIESCTFVYVHVTQPHEDKQIRVQINAYNLFIYNTYNTTLNVALIPMQVLFFVVRSRLLLHWWENRACKKK